MILWTSPACSECALYCRGNMLYYLVIITFILGQIAHSVSVCQARTIIVDVTETVIIAPTPTNVLTTRSSSLTNQQSTDACPQGTLVSKTCLVFVTSTAYYLGSTTQYMTPSFGTPTPAVLRRAVTAQYGNSSVASNPSSGQYPTSTVTVVEFYPALSSSCK